MPLFGSMQAIVLKISLFLSFLTGSGAWAADRADTLRRADSLFAADAQSDAARLYEAVLSGGFVPTDAMLLKLASTYERQSDVPHLLYYLQIYFDRHPDDAVLRRMDDIARANNLGGYETDDLNYFYLFYKQYGIYFQLFLLVLAMYSFGVLLTKSLRQQPIPARQKWVLLIYLLGLLLFVNLPRGVRSGITNQDRVLLRTDPSAAAPVAEVISRGNKLNILGSRDIYLRVRWRNQWYYVRQDQVWVI